MTPETYARVLAEIEATPTTPRENVAVCGECGFAWDDTKSTSLTPAPSARCPNEYNHCDTDYPISVTKDISAGESAIIHVSPGGQPGVLVDNETDDDITVTITIN